MRRRRFLEALTAALLAILMIGHGVAFAQGKKPPKDDGGGGDDGGGISTVMPPMRYWINSFSMPADDDGHRNIVNQMTSSGVVVGDYRDLNGAIQPYVYDPSIDPDSAINLNAFGIVGIPEGWRIYSAGDMNDLGYVVGPLEKLDTPGFFQGYLLDLASATPTLYTLPDGPLHTYSRRINNSMDVLGVFRRADGSWGGYTYNPLIDTVTNDLGLRLDYIYHELSNPEDGGPAMVTGRLEDGTCYRLTIGENLEVLSDLPDPSYIHDINPHGDLCGRYHVFPKGNKSAISVAFRYGSQEETFSDFQYAYAITGDGDLVLSSSVTNSYYLHHEGTGTILLDDVIVGSDADLAEWAANGKGVSDMTERGTLNSDVPDYPGICGVLIPSSGVRRGFVLVPVPAP